MLIADTADESGRRVVSEIVGAGGTAAFVHTDVRHESDVIRAVSDVVQRWGALDVLVNAGIGKGTDEQSVFETEDWIEIIDVDLRSVYFGMTKAASESRSTAWTSSRVSTQCRT